MAASDCYSPGKNGHTSLMPYEEALAKLIGRAEKLTETECISLIQANDRILAEDIIAAHTVPPADNSSMDGYAVRHADLATKGEKHLKVSQRICAGHAGVALEAGTAARIFTGAPIPLGADAVIMQEDCTVDGGSIITRATPKPGENIRYAGEDIKEGTNILPAGHRIQPQDMGLMASVGIGEVTVYRHMRVAIFSTGDELREPGESLEPGQIFNSNRYTLRGLLEKSGCDTVDLGIVKDTLEATRNIMLQAADQADLVITSGGVSVGEEDHIRTALETVGHIELWQIKMKPGKPFTFGMIGNTPFIGLPGNPVSVFAGFCIFCRPFILRTQGCEAVAPRSYSIKADFDWPHKGARTEFLRVKMSKDEAGENVLSLYHTQSSGVLSSTSWASGLAIVQAGKTVKKGQIVEYYPFNEYL